MVCDGMINDCLYLVKDQRYGLVVVELDPGKVSRITFNRLVNVLKSYRLPNDLEAHTAQEMVQRLQKEVYDRFRRHSVLMPIQKPTSICCKSVSFPPGQDFNVVSVGTSRPSTAMNLSQTLVLLVHNKPARKKFKTLVGKNNKSLAV